MTATCLNNSSEARRGFLHALQKSVARRRADPSIVVHRPAFPMRALTEASFDASPQRMALSASPTTKSGTLKRGIFAALGHLNRRALATGQRPGLSRGGF